MSKADLKTALQALQVNQPLRLKAPAPTFTAPPPPIDPRVHLSPGTEPAPGLIQSEDTKSTQGQNQPGMFSAKIAQDLDRTEETIDSNPGQNQTPGSLSSQGSKTIQGSNLSPGSNPSEGAFLPRDSSPPPVERIARSSQPRRATPQDEAVLAVRGVESGLVRGYTRLPNSLLMRLTGGDCSKHEAQVLLLVARLTISFRREMAPISKSLIEKYTGIRGSAVLQTLARLEGAGLIRRIPGNERRPSQIGLVLEPDWDRPKPEGGDNPGAKSTQGSFHSRGEIASGDRIAPASPGCFEPTGKSIDINKRNKNTLSPLSKKIEEYIASVKPLRKRERELQALGELREAFSDEDIAECLEQVRRHGVRKGGDTQEPCHSPMAYLAVSIHDVLLNVQAQRKKARLRAEREAQEREAQRRLEERDVQETRHTAAREAAFTESYPTAEEQIRVIAEYCRGLPFSPQTPVARTIAVGRWWADDQRRKQ